MNVPSYLYGGFISDTTTMSEHRRRAPDVKNSALPHCAEPSQNGRRRN